MDSVKQFHLLNLSPVHGTYAPGEAVTNILTLESEIDRSLLFLIRIFNGPDLILQSSETHRLQAGENKLSFSWQPPVKSPAGYGIEIVVEDGGLTYKIETGFDVLSDWTDFPRYGFLCDFFPNRADEEHTMQTLTKFHINGLQFYDWQYRHDELVAPTDEFTDPLGRKLSLIRTRNLIRAAHEHGMAAMPYLTIYAASAAFWKTHPDWMLYDAEHKPIPFGDDFLGIMNPVRGGNWHTHLLKQCKAVLAALPFDGLHIDQFGEPKMGFDQDRQPVDIPLAFRDFITGVAEQHSNTPIVFNAVGNWPIETLAPSSTSFNYIEIWPPDVHYSDVVQIVRNARSLSDGKPVVIALYMPAKYISNHLLANALIICAGGTRIELGENARLLTDPYFPKHEEMPPDLESAIRKQNDMIVRYEEWFGPIIDETFGVEIMVPKGVECFYRRSGSRGSLGLVNLKSETTLVWNEETPQPKPFGPFTVEIRLEEAPKKVLWVDPGGDSLAAIPLGFSYSGNKLSIQIAEITLWMIVLFEF